MTDVADKLERGPDRGPMPRCVAALVNAARASGQPLLFGLRLWASVCLALYVAFWLQLDNPYWAGTSAALMSQPHLGASLRKGWFRMVGTLVGAVAIVVLTAWFPQSRAGFLVGLALWGGACALVATLLHNFAAYAAALAGFTAAIIASDELGATGGTNGLAFTLAISRVSEIWIGIVCAGIVLAGTDFGTAPRRLAASFAALSAEIASRFGSTLVRAGSAFSETQSVRRELTRRVIELDPIIDEAIGESSRIRYHSPVLQAAVDGLLAAIAGWRTVAVRLARLPGEAARQETDAVLPSVPQELRSAPEQQAEPKRWMADPIGMRQIYAAAAGKLLAMPAGTPSLRLVADQTANVLGGLSHALDGLALLVGGFAGPPSGRRLRFYVPDWLPGLVNAGRAFVVIGAAEVFWIVTEWPNGASAITWTAIPVILLAPQADAAYARTKSFAAGTGLAAVCAAIILFAVLPRLSTFVGLGIAMGAYLVPVGALMVKSPWQTAMFVPMVANFVPLLAPTNPQSYDTVQFYNAALAIIAGFGAAALSFRLLPPLSPILRTRRLLALTLRDVRRVATDRVRRSRVDWEGRMYSRLAALPGEADPVHRGQLAAALSVGTEITHLRRTATQLGLGVELNSALEAFAAGDSATAIARFSCLDRRLASLPDSDPQTPLAVQGRGRILAISDALVQHRSYFDAGGVG
jgi:uncharacterized membrane protein YccC